MIIGKATSLSNIFSDQFFLSAWIKQYGGDPLGLQSNPVTNPKINTT
jgi:hypothetical protein